MYLHFIAFESQPDQLQWYIMYHYNCKILNLEDDKYIGKALFSFGMPS